jgi:hypothetical protein
MRNVSDRKGNKSYDVFLSYKSEHKLWVEVLASNLLLYGYRVWLDSWEVVGGSSFVRSLYEGIKQARRGILVVTPDAIHSGWVREEYEQMMVQKHQDPGFSIIPLLVGREVPDFPFLSSVQIVDFRNPSDYRKAFYCLLCALEGEPPGPKVRLAHEPEIPAPIDKIATDLKNGERIFVNQIFDSVCLPTVQALLLLAQADQGQENLIQAILIEANSLYGSERTLHLMPPYSPRTNSRDYFRMLGKQCNSNQDIISAIHLQSCLEDRLISNQRLFLLISGFEHSSKEGREELAGCLRALN